MPSIGQIQPEFLHSHVATYINDNSTFQDTAAQTSDSNIQMMFVFASGRGRDGVFLPFKDDVSHVKEYGKPNMKLYGQAGYMPIVSLRTGVVTAKCMRIAADDATYSNAIVGLKVKVDKTTNPSEPKMIVKFISQYQQDVMNKDEMASFLDAIKDENPDADEFVTFPLLAGYCLGRGIYGDDYRMRINQSPQGDKDNAFKNIRFEVLATENGLRRVEFFEGAVFEEALAGNTSLYFKDKVNDIETGSNLINIEVNELTLYEIFELYRTEIDPATTLTIETFDIFGFRDKAGKMIKGVELDTVSVDAITLDSVEGISLTGGSDGAFSAKTDKAARDEAINAKYLEAFAGTVNREILSKRRHKTDIILDANFSDEVKQQIASLAAKRNSGMLYLDTGILNTVTELMDWAETNKGIANRIFSKNAHSFKVRDPFTKRPIEVTSTYYLASALPIHFRDNGRHIPFAGATAPISGFIKGTLKPVIDMDDVEIKEYLYERQVNYFECINENVYQRANQSTAQTIMSDLSEEHNMHELFDMKREIEEYTATTLYNFSEINDRTRYTEDAKALFSSRKGVRSVDIVFDMNKWEEERSIMHCYMAVVFKTIAKRAIIEIDINKRV